MDSEARKRSADDHLRGLADFARRDAAHLGGSMALTPERPALTTETKTATGSQHSWNGSMEPGRPTGFPRRRGHSIEKQIPQTPWRTRALIALVCRLRGGESWPRPASGGLQTSAVIPTGLAAPAHSFRPRPAPTPGSGRSESAVLIGRHHGNHILYQPPAIATGFHYQANLIAAFSSLARTCEACPGR